MAALTAVTSRPLWLPIVGVCLVTHSNGTKGSPGQQAPEGRWRRNRQSPDMLAYFTGKTMMSEASWEEWSLAGLILEGEGEIFDI